MLVLYTKGFADAYSGDELYAQINYLVGVANACYSNSEVNLTSRVAGIREVNYKDSGKMGDALDDLTNGGTRVSHFSNPNVTYSELTTGTSDANNARSVRNVKLTISQFRDSVCNGSITVSPDKLTLDKEENDEITVTVTGWDDNPSVGETVKATVNAAGKKRVSVSPSSGITDSNGQSTFTITACRERYLLSVSSVKSVVSTVFIFIPSRTGQPCGDILGG